MELSEKTLKILNNFKTIQGNLVFRPGKNVNTMATLKNIVASAELDEEIDQEFGIYDLGEFIATMNLVESPELEIKKDHAVVSSKSGRSRVKYYFSDPEMLTFPAKTINMPSTEVSFDLDVGTLNRLKKASMTLGHDSLIVRPSSGALELSVGDLTNKTSNVFSIDVAGEFESEDFALVISIENLKLLPADYEVKISKKLISHFKSKDRDIPVEYWIALEKSSEYKD